MFALIKTNGATHIAINIPKEGAAASLPALAAMLERNAVFVVNHWSEIKTVTPEMTITLGDTAKFESSNGLEMAVCGEGSVIGADFAIATPEVYLSVKQAVDKKEAELVRLRTELAGVKAQLEAAKATIDDLSRKGEDAE